MFVPHLEKKQWYEPSGHKLECLEAWQKQKCEQGGPGVHRRGLWQTGMLRPHSTEIAATQLQSNLPYGIVGPVLTDLLPFQKKPRL